MESDEGLVPEDEAPVDGKPVTEDDRIQPLDAPPSHSDPSQSEHSEEFLNAVVDTLLELAPGVELMTICNLVEEHLASYGPMFVVEFVVERIFQDVLPPASHAELVASNTLDAPSVERLSLMDSDVNVTECRCCIEDIPTAQVVHCASGHTFCRQCVHRYVSHQLGLQTPLLFCMDTGGCQATFRRSDLRDLLPENLFGLYERLEQRWVLKEAKITGYEECPFCDWGCILETPKEVDPSFICGGCGVQSCRLCKKVHPTQSCGGNEEGKVNNHRLLIEEAMTAAMSRQCPQCSAGECLSRIEASCSSLRDYLDSLCEIRRGEYRL